MIFAELSGPIAVLAVILANAIGLTVIVPLIMLELRVPRREVRA